MCLACVEFQRGRLTFREYLRNVAEFPYHEEADLLTQEVLESLLPDENENEGANNV